MIAAWGRENALKVCRITIYVTDPDPYVCETLRAEFAKTEIVTQNPLRFERPDFAGLVDDHMVDVICSRRKSNSLLAFCGSPALANELHKIKISTDMVSANTGNKRHQMEYVSESYGGTKASTYKSTHCENESMGRNNNVEGGPLTTRLDREYFLESFSFAKKHNDSILRFGRLPAYQEIDSESIDG